MDENQLCSKYARSNNNKSRWSGQRIFADELSHQCECLPYIWRPWSLWKALSSLTKYNYSLYCASGTSRALFWQAWHLTAGALQSSRGLLLPFPRRCSHTSPTAGVLVSIPSLAELTSPCRTPPLQFTWSRLISTSLSSRLQFRDQRPAEKGTLSSDRSPCYHGRCVCAAGLEISPRKGHLDWKESEWSKSCAARYACLTEPEMCTQLQKPHPLTEAAERLQPRYEQNVRSWGLLLLAFAHFIEWCCKRVEREEGGRHFHTSDNSWPVPRQEECRLIRARAIELRPEPIQLGVQHGEASVFKLLLQLSCQNESGKCRNGSI